VRRRLDLVELGLATVAVYQLSGSTWRKLDIRPFRGRYIGLRCGLDHAGHHEIVVLISATGTCPHRGRNKLGDYAAVRGNGNALAGFDLPHVMAQIVFQVTDAGRDHVANIATCGHICNVSRSDARNLSVDTATCASNRLRTALTQRCQPQYG